MTGVAEPDDLGLVAAEYVIGTLDAVERAAFAERLRDDDRAKRSVGEWEARLAGLADRVDPVRPPPHVWAAIDQALQGAPSRPRRFEVLEGGGRPVDRDRAPLAVSRNRWRAAAVGFGSLAAALVAFIAVDRVPRVPAPSGGSYVAAISPGGDKPALLVRVDLATRKVYVMPVAAKVPSGHSLELWYIGDDKTPRPVGIVDKEAATLPMPVDTTPAGATLAVSVEPPGGSTTGGPTGPVVYSGQLVKE